MQQIDLTFSNGWISKFEKRNNFKAYKSHGESGDADEEAIRNAMPSLRATLSMYRLNDIFNADEYVLFYTEAPNITIGPGPLKGNKKRKDRITFLVCANVDGTERLPPLVIGRSKNPQSFDGQERSEHGFDYHHSKKAWMTCDLFYEWLKRFDSIIGTTAGRRVLLLIDNASCHGTESTLPNLDHVQVVFLPKNTTSKLQPMDAGVIACIKKRYRRRQIERAADLIELGITENLYKIDIFQAVTNIYDIWNRIESSIIYNCWVQTGLITGNSTIAPDDFHAISDINIGIVSDIVFSSFYPEEDLCYDSSKSLYHTSVLFPSKIV